jgi:hypothetical protein
MKRLAFYLLLSLLTTCVFSQSTTWQWVRGGGSTGSAFSSGLDEDTQWLGLDQAGNIYGLSMIFDGDIQIDTSHLSHGFGYDDFALFSYRCDGSFRWARYFGSGVNDIAFGLHTDQEGNSYIAGGVNPYQNLPSHFGDSTITVSEPGVIIKVDSSGHTEWISFLPSTAPYLISLCDIQEDNQGNLLVLIQTGISGTWGPFTFPGKGFYMAKFNKDDGSIIGLDKLELDGHIWGVQFSVDQQDNY